MYSGSKSPSECPVFDQEAHEELFRTNVPSGILIQPVVIDKGNWH